MGKIRGFLARLGWSHLIGAAVGDALVVWLGDALGVGTLPVEVQVSLYVIAAVVGALIAHGLEEAFVVPRRKLKEKGRELEGLRDELEALRSERPEIDVELDTNYRLIDEGRSRANHVLKVRNLGASATFSARLTVLEDTTATATTLPLSTHPLFWYRDGERRKRLDIGDVGVLEFAYTEAAGDGGSYWGLSVEERSGEESSAGPEDTAGIPIEVEITVSSDPLPPDGPWVGRFRVFRDGCTRLDADNERE